MRKNISGAERAFLDAALEDVIADPEEVFGLEFRTFSIMRETIERENQARHPHDRTDFASLGPPTIAMCNSLDIGDDDLFTAEQCAIITTAREASVTCQFERMLKNPEAADMNEVQGLHCSLAIRGYYDRDPKYRRGHDLLEFHACANYLRQSLAEIESGESQLFIATVMETYGYKNLASTELIEERLALMKKHQAAHFTDDAGMVAQISGLGQRYQPLRDKAATGFLEIALRRDILLQKDIAAKPEEYAQRDEKNLREHQSLVAQYPGHTNLPPTPEPLKNNVAGRVSKAQQELGKQQTKLKELKVPVTEWSGRIARKDIKGLEERKPIPLELG